MHPIQSAEVKEEAGNPYPQPFHSRMGKATWRALGDQFGLTQFGFNLETLEPGAQSALRHWHTLSDELIYMLEGELALVTNEGESVMTPGMCIGFKAGDNNAHHLVNKSTKTARFIVVGTRAAGDTVFYPDDDLAWFHNGSKRVAVHNDGRPY
jgi:uncharacterized cupin superfamily protein